MVIQEKQVYEEFFNDQTITIECFKSNDMFYVDKITFEKLVKFLDNHKNNLIEGVMKDMFNMIRSELNTLINEINAYKARFNNFYNHYDDSTKQFAYQNEIVNTLKFVIGDQHKIDKLIQHDIIIITEIKLESEIINTLIMQYNSLENKYLELRKKNLQLEATIEIFKGYYEHKYKALYDYPKLKEAKKILHKEFIMVAKLMKLNK